MQHATQAALPIDEPANTSGIFPLSPRGEVIAANLLKIHLLVWREPPEPTSAEWFLSVLTWDEALEAVPLNRLDEVFRTAVQRHRGSYLLGVSEVLSVWDELREQKVIAMRALPMPVRKGNCERCRGMGFLCDRFDEHGAWKWPKLMPCPECS